LAVVLRQSGLTQLVLAIREPWINADRLAKFERGVAVFLLCYVLLVRGKVFGLGFLRVALARN
jgi:hypothetical protein